MNSSMKWAIQLVSSNLRLFIVRLKCSISNDLVARFADALFINLCIFETAHVSQLTILRAFNSLRTVTSFIFLSCSIIFDLQCSSRRCHLHEVAFDISRDCTKLVWLLKSIEWELNSIVNSSKCFSISHIFWSFFLLIKVFENMSERILDSLAY